MTAEDLKNIRDFVEGVAVSSITMPSQRDRQVAPGPSDLANKCDLCVARKIAASLGVGEQRNNNFSLKAWNGTAVHEKLERDLPQIYSHAEQEIEVEIATIPGLGRIIGHIDVYLPHKLTIVDWKTKDLKAIETYKKQAGQNAHTKGLTFQERTELRHLTERQQAGRLTMGSEDMVRLAALVARSEDQLGGFPQEHLGQTMLYLYGLRAMGRPAEYAALVFIPRDSNDVTDIWVTVCEYQPDVAEGVLRRAEHLTRLVRQGRVGELKAHPQCFPCEIRPKLRK